MKVFLREVMFNCVSVDRVTNRKSRKKTGVFNLLTFSEERAEHQEVLNNVVCRGWRNLLVVQDTMYAQHPERDVYVRLPAGVVGRLYLEKANLEELFFIIDVQENKFVLKECPQDFEATYWIELSTQDVGKKLKIGDKCGFIKKVDPQTRTLILWNETLRHETSYPWTILLSPNASMGTEHHAYVQEMAKRADNALKHVHITSARVEGGAGVTATVPEVVLADELPDNLYTEYQRMTVALTDSFRALAEGLPEDTLEARNNSVLMPISCVRQLLEINADIPKGSWIDIINPANFYENSNIERTFTGQVSALHATPDEDQPDDGYVTKLSTLSRYWYNDTLNISLKSFHNIERLDGFMTASPGEAREKVLDMLEKHFDKVAFMFKLVTLKDTQGNFHFQVLPCLALA